MTEEMERRLAGHALSGIPCNLCGALHVEELSLVDRDGNRLRTVACKDCGLVWTDPRPEDMRTFYEKEYRLRYKGTFKPKPKHIHRAGKVAVERYERIKSHVRKGASLLDVGSGGGEFIYLMRMIGCKVTGIEPNEGYAGYSVSEYGLDVRFGFIQDAELEDASQDIVTMWHVLEHTEDPSSIIERVGGWIRDGGILIVEVPNVEGTCQAPGHRFHLAHLYNFNSRTLRGIGEKAGLKAVEETLSYDGGNIMTVFRKEARMNPPASNAIPGNFERIAGIIRGHTAARHFATRHPYVRFARKLSRVIDEKISTAGTVNGKPLLDAVYGDVAIRGLPRASG